MMLEHLANRQAVVSLLGVWLTGPVFLSILGSSGCRGTVGMRSSSAITPTPAHSPPSPRKDAFLVSTFAEPLPFLT